jgi:predicted subunit of tRNA(5-methylaminomethyl-2-thiouridylate) methyltransferase
MEVALLYSGGKDSTLAADCLAPFYDVTLVTGTFGVTDDWRHARRVADRLGYPFRRLDLDPAVAAEAVDRLLADGYPRHAIQAVHDHALERAADLGPAAVADGTRRDDRVPTVPRSTARSLEDRRGVDYLAPLAGFGRGAVDRLADARLDVETGPSGTMPRADYEAELRALLADRAGDDAVDRIFPAHEQSYVRGATPSRPRDDAVDTPK